MEILNFDYRNHHHPGPRSINSDPEGELEERGDRLEVHADLTEARG